jgi:hypothetical protein
MPALNEVMLDLLVKGELKLYIMPVEAAKPTGRSASTIRRAVAQGEMVSMRSGKGRGGAIHIRTDMLVAWCKQKEDTDSARPTD